MPDWTREQASRGVALVKKGSEARFGLGDLALEVAPMGDDHGRSGAYDVLQAFAAEIGCEFEALRQYRVVAGEFADGTRVPSVSWSVFREILGAVEVKAEFTKGRTRTLRTAQEKREWLVGLKAALPVTIERTEYKRVTVDLVRRCRGLEPTRKTGGDEQSPAQIVERVVQDLERPDVREAMASDTTAVNAVVRATSKALGQTRRQPEVTDHERELDAYGLLIRVQKAIADAIRRLPDYTPDGDMQDEADQTAAYAEQGAAFLRAWAANEGNVTDEIERWLTQQGDVR